MDKQERCIYCGRLINKKDSFKKINIENESLKEVHCCSDECFDQAIHFMNANEKQKFKLYCVLGLAVLADLLLMGLTNNQRYIYLPLAIMGISLFFWPYTMIRYRSYQRSGIQRTLGGLRKAGLIIAILSIVFFIFS